MQKLINSVQHYAWGSKTALTELYGIANPDHQPMAELWIGAHPGSPSMAVLPDGQHISLRDLIAARKTTMLGKTVARQFGELPFLFKVLCADQPLSIQVHPSKAAAEAGFIKENQAGIPLDAPERNYKDPNHKPELVYALTPFLAMNGFREQADMVALLSPLADAHHAIAHFLKNPGQERLAQLFSRLLSMEGDVKSRALDALNTVLTSHQGQPWDTIREIARFWPDDNGLFSPLLLNVITLQPGEAMFLFAETPHAYLKGNALEVMANSDNVLRAGLTPKFIDIPELLANITFVSKPVNELLTPPRQEGPALYYPIPVDDFAFTLHKLTPTPQSIIQHSATILFCTEGQAVINNQHQQTLTLRSGESCFIPANEFPLLINGTGKLARVWNDMI
ncbi:mannose-6-phosphate isomerase [Enterobacteriaceae bacterium LUAb1]